MKKQSAIVTSTVPTFEALLEKMMPHFRYFAKRMKRRYKRFDFDDAIQELVGMALEMYHSLVRRGKEVFYTPIMKYAIGHYCEGRRFTGTNSTDICSHQTQIKGRSEVYSLFDDTGEIDRRYLMQDRKADVFLKVQTKLDLQDWYHMQTTRDQDYITDLALGYTQSEVAKRHGVSPGAICQRQRKYATSWSAFIDPPEESGAVVAA